ncbi:hypothetical protein ADN00_09015 [Ornatilinea apprima]|uniref:Uncharacterized protein n=1 Tax=Ornatilinea apprima TaxID=1134406 RepID=A0A0P6Y6Q7_9CHLR|nr:hypothetical protein [Ornatilinea apprima]KPL77269.1 hypothetical protein ADN00_09015 [Ornatilinea apprima]
MDKNEEYELIRQYAPVLKFTRGEKFYPMRVDEYLRSSSLWARLREGAEVCLVPQGSLDVDKLDGSIALPPDALQFLKFIEPVDLPELLEYLQEQIRQKDDFRFHPGKGRLSRVGYLSRFVDLLFSLTLLARGRVSGDTSMAATLEYRRILERNPVYSYYARVVRQNDWLVLQYWYFYAFNNWRSGYFGLNDHEADWEMVNIYLSEQDGSWQPEWLAYACHEFSGDDLRRHWNDPEVQKVGDHPVVFVGAGSHAGYFLPGEYLMELDVPFLAPIYRVVEFIQRRWQSLTGSGSTENENRGNILRIPFVDYARGDGFSVGEGQYISWAPPILLDPTPQWVSEYRGLWGLYAQDPASGENAPSGPMYQRNGALRSAWYNPLGWAGVDKVPTQANTPHVINQQKQTLISRLEELNGLIDQKSGELQGTGVSYQAFQNEAGLSPLMQTTEKKLDDLSDELAGLRREAAAIDLEISALDRYLTQPAQAGSPAFRNHIQRAHTPALPAEGNSGRVEEWWAAASVALMLFGFVLLMIFSRQHIVFGTSVMIALFVFIESSFRRTLSRLINSLAIGLAAAAFLLILFHYFWYFVVFSIIAVGIFILLENLKELIH